LLKINPEASSNPASLSIFVEAALKHGIEGIVLESTTHESHVEQLAKIRAIDTKH
jgi:ABC-type Zn uptake system ZnuABC Zn-binding protein ZnuA